MCFCVGSQLPMSSFFSLVCWRRHSGPAPKCFSLSINIQDSLNHLQNWRILFEISSRNQQFSHLHPNTSRPNDLWQDPHFTHLVLFTGGVVGVFIWSADWSVFASTWGTMQHRGEPGDHFWIHTHCFCTQSWAQSSTNKHKCDRRMVRSFLLAWGRTFNAWQAAMRHGFTKAFHKVRAKLKGQRKYFAAVAVHFLNTSVKMRLQLLQLAKITIGLSF